MQKKGGGNWVVGVDFNTVLRREEMSGVNSSVSWAHEFREVLDGLELVNLLLVGGQWTGTN